ncbi:hypothetical protein GAN17_11010 [Mycobacterium kubicae]|uniref:rhamnan synthesis F family protein n=1 Tax=Mycobacterium kubicae TaxID=120959 RepID=UPI00164179DF|nr:rhamnan synthesis F family protein [Mycobacterium kubicae]QNI06766.1 hypothetical protein GAN17_11010 [Mycobacterium kubicae]
MKSIAMLRNQAQRNALLDAARYRLSGDAMSFLCETHLQLAPQPSRGDRTLILFAHFDPDGVVDPYVAYYLEQLKGVRASIVFVSGSPTLTPESVAPIRSLCSGIFTRQTLSLDFGSWHLAWRILQESGWSLTQFDRLVLANDSVYGPLFPIEEMWSVFHDADMYGAIESEEQESHLQSFFLAWDLNERTRRFLEKFWNRFQYIVDKNKLVRRYEIGLSKRARQEGLSIKPFVSAATVSATYRQSPAHQWSDKLSSTNRINNTLYFWDGLIEHHRFPFLKTILPRHNMPWHDSMAHLPQFLEQHTAYPYSLIEANVNRLGYGPSFWANSTPTP